jgi:enoyl-CoA hydratase
VNALDIVAFNEIHQVLDELLNDEQCRVLILTAKGKSFSAGADISSAHDEATKKAFAPTGPKLTSRIESIDKPTLCAINGFAIGGGLEIALAFDFRIASENAKFGQAEIGVGSIPGSGGTQRLPRLIGKPKAKRLIFTGEMIDAQEAYRIGLVDAVVPPDRLVAEAKKVAEAIASKSPFAIRLAKKAIDEGFELPLPGGLAVEWKYFSEVINSEDFEEGMRAFAEKRPPVFKGR